MHKRKMREVQKVFNNARGAGVDRVRPTIDFAQAGITLSRKQWHSLLAFYHLHPQQTIRLKRPVGASALA